MAEMIVDELKPGKNERYVEERKGFVRPKDLDREHGARSSRKIRAMARSFAVAKP